MENSRYPPAQVVIDQLGRGVDDRERTDHFYGARRVGVTVKGRMDETVHMLALCAGSGAGPLADQPKRRRRAARILLAAGQHVPQVRRGGLAVLASQRLGP
jgi:hypothetical protein